MSEMIARANFTNAFSQLRQHLQAFIDAYNFAKKLKAIKGLTPWEFVIKEWKSNPKSFIIKPNPFNMGPNTRK